MAADCMKGYHQSSSTHIENPTTIRRDRTIPLGEQRALSSVEECVNVKVVWTSSMFTSGSGPPQRSHIHPHCEAMGGLLVTNMTVC